jgi:transposase
MARPKGTAEQLEELRKIAIRMYAEGASVAEIARHVRRTETAVRQWLREAASPELIAINQLRTKVRTRLQQNAAAVTRGRHRAWTTHALPWAFGSAYVKGFVDEIDELPPGYFVDRATEWGCRIDEQGVWRVQ